MPTKRTLEAEQTADEGFDAAQAALTPQQIRVIHRITQMLVGLQLPDIARKARREGFTNDELKTAWALARVARGEERSLDHFLFGVHDESAAQSDEIKRLLKEVDEFENTWFVRLRAIIQRVVARAHRQEFEAVFFKDLKQQPLGPGVIGSVSTFLARLDELPRSQLPDADKVLATVRARGLTPAKVKHVRELLAQFEKEVTPEKAPKVDPAEIKQAFERQLEAYEDLRDWYRDWATTFRSVFTSREQIRLGLVVVRRDGSTVHGEDATDEGDAGDEKAPG